MVGGTPLKESDSSLLHSKHPCQKGTDPGTRATILAAMLQTRREMHQAQASLALSVLGGILVGIAWDVFYGAITAIIVILVGNLVQPPPKTRRWAVQLRMQFVSWAQSFYGYMHHVCNILHDYIFKPPYLKVILPLTSRASTKIFRWYNNFLTATTRAWAFLKHWRVRRWVYAGLWVSYVALIALTTASLFLTLACLACSPCILFGLFARTSMKHPQTGKVFRLYKRLTGLFGKKTRIRPAQKRDNGRFGVKMRYLGRLFFALSCILLCTIYWPLEEIITRCRRRNRFWAGDCKVSPASQQRKAKEKGFWAIRRLKRQKRVLENLLQANETDLIQHYHFEEIPSSKGDTIEWKPASLSLVLSASPSPASVERLIKVLQKERERLREDQSHLIPTVGGLVECRKLHASLFLQYWEKQLPLLEKLENLQTQLKSLQDAKRLDKTSQSNIKMTRVMLDPPTHKHHRAIQVLALAITAIFAIQFWAMIQEAMPNNGPKISSIPVGTTRNLYLNYTAIQLDEDKVFTFWAQGPNYLYVELAPISDPLAVELAEINIGLAGAPTWDRDEFVCYPGPNLFHLPYPLEEWNDDPESAGACLYNVSISPADAPAFRRICVQPVILAAGAGNLTGSLGAPPITFNFSAGGLVSVVLYGSNVEFGNLTVIMDPVTPSSVLLKADCTDLDLKLPTQIVSQMLTGSNYLQFQADLEPGPHQVSFQGDGFFSFKCLNTYGSWDDDTLSDVEEAMFEGSLPRVDIFHTSIYGTKTEHIRNRNSVDFLNGGTYSEEWVPGTIKFTIPKSFGEIFGTGYPLDSWIVVSQGVYTNFSLDNSPIEPSNLTLSGYTSDSEEPVLVTEEDGTQILRAKRDIVQLSNHYLGDLLPGTHTLDYTYLNEPFTEPEITIYVHDIPVIITGSGTMPDDDADEDFDNLPTKFDASCAASLIYESGTLLQLVIPVPSDETEDVQLEFNVHPPEGEWNRSMSTLRWRGDEQNAPLVKIKPTLVLYGPAEDVEVKSLTFWDVPRWDTLQEMATYLGEDGSALPVHSYNLVATTADGIQHLDYASGVATFEGDADPLPLFKSAGAYGQYHLVFGQEAQETWQFGPLDYSRESEALSDGALDIRIRWMWSIIEVDDDGTERNLLGLYPISSSLTIQAITMKTYSDANYVVGAPRSASEASILTAYATRPDVPISTSRSPPAPGKAGMNDALRNAIIGEGFGLRFLPSYYYDSNNESTWGLVERATYDYHTAYYYLDANFTQVPAGEFPVGWIYEESELAIMLPGEGEVSSDVSYARVEDNLWGQYHPLCLYDTTGYCTAKPEVIADIAPMPIGSANFTIGLGSSAAKVEVGFFFNTTSGVWPVATRMVTGIVPFTPYNILLDYDQPRGLYNLTIQQGDYSWNYVDLPMQNATCPPNQFRLRTLPAIWDFTGSLPYVTLGDVRIWSRRAEQAGKEAGITLYCVTEKSNDILWAINQSIFFQQAVGERFLFYPGNDMARLLPDTQLSNTLIPSWSEIGGDIKIEDWYQGHGNALKFTPDSCATKSFAPTNAGTLIFEFCLGTDVQAEFTVASVDGINAASLQIVDAGDRSYLQYKNRSGDAFNWVNLCEVWEGEWFSVQFYEFDLTRLDPRFTIFVDGAYAGTALDVPLLNNVATIGNLKVAIKSGAGGLLFDAAQLIPSSESEINQASLPLDFPSVHFGEMTSRVYFGSIAERYNGRYSLLDEELQGPKGTLYSTSFTDVLHARECIEVEEFPVSICYIPTTASSYFLSARFQFSDALNISYVSSTSLPLDCIPDSPTCPYLWLIGDIPDEAIYEHRITLETPPWLIKDGGAPVLLFNDLKGDIIRSVVDMRPGEVDFLAQLYERHSGPEFGFIWEISNQIIETSMEIEKVMIQSKMTLGAMSRSPEFTGVVEGWKSYKYLPQWTHSSSYKKYYNQGYWAFHQATGEWNYVRERVPIEWTVNDIISFADNFIKASGGLAKMLRAEIGDTLELYRQVILPETWWQTYITTHTDFFDQTLADKIFDRTQDAKLVADLRSGTLPKNFAFLPDEIELLPKSLFYEVPISYHKTWRDPDDPFGTLRDGGYLRPQMSGYVGDPKSFDVNAEGVWKRGCYIKKMDVEVTWEEKCLCLQRACVGKPENSFIFKSNRYKMPGTQVKAHMFWWRVLGSPPVPSLGNWNEYKAKVIQGWVASGLGESEPWLTPEQITEIESGGSVSIRIYAEPGSRWEQLHGVEAFVYNDAAGVLKVEGMWYGTDWSLNPTYRPQGSIESGDSMIYSARSWMRLTWDLLEYSAGYYGKNSPYTDGNGLWLKQDTNPFWMLTRQYILVWRMLESETATPPARIAKYFNDVSLPTVNGKTIIPLGIGAPHVYQTTPLKELVNLYRGWDDGGTPYQGSLMERLFEQIDAIQNVNKRPPGQTSFFTFKRHKPGAKTGGFKTVLKKNPNYLKETDITSLNLEDDIKYILMIAPLLQGYTDFEGPAGDRKDPFTNKKYDVRVLPGELEAKISSLLAGFKLKYGLSSLMISAKFAVEIPYDSIDGLLRSQLKNFEGLDRINAKRVSKGLPAARNFDHLMYLVLTEGGLESRYVFNYLMRSKLRKSPPTPILEPGATRALYEQISAGVRFRGQIAANKPESPLKQDLWLLSKTDGEYSLRRFMYEVNVYDGLVESGKFSTQDHVVRAFASWLRASLELHTRAQRSDATGEIYIQRITGVEGKRTYLEIRYLQPARGAASMPVRGPTQFESYDTGEAFKYIWVQGEGVMARDEALEKGLINPNIPNNRRSGSGPAAAPGPGDPGDTPPPAGASGKGLAKSTAKQAQDMIEALEVHRAPRTTDDPGREGDSGTKKQPAPSPSEGPGARLAKDYSAKGTSLLGLPVDKLENYLIAEETYTRIAPTDLLGNVGDYGVRQFLANVKYQAEIDELIFQVRGMASFLEEVTAHLEHTELERSHLVAKMGEAQKQAEIQQYIFMKYGVWDNAIALVITTIYSIYNLARQTENPNAIRPGAIIQGVASAGMIMWKASALGKAVDARAFTPKWRVESDSINIKRYSPTASRAFDSFKFPLLMDFLFMIPDVMDMTAILEEHGVPSQVALSRAIAQFLPPILIEAVLDFAIALGIQVLANVWAAGAAVLSSTAASTGIGIFIAALAMLLWNMLVDWYNSNVNNSVSVGYASDLQTLTWEPALLQHGGLRAGDELFYAMAWNNTGATSIWYQQQVSAGSPTEQWGGGSRYTLSNNSHGVSLPVLNDHDPTFMGSCWELVHNFDSWMQAYGGTFYLPGNLDARWVSGEDSWAGSKYGLNDTGEYYSDYVGRYWPDEAIDWADTDARTTTIIDPITGIPVTVTDPTGEPADWDFFAHKVPVAAPTTELHLYVINDMDSWVRQFGGFYRYNGAPYTQDMIMGDLNGDGWLDPDLERPIRVLDATFAGFVGHCSVVKQPVLLDNLKANLTDAINRFQWKTASEYLSEIREFASAQTVLDESSFNVRA